MIRKAKQEDKMENEVFTKNNQIIQWLRHSEETVFLIEDSWDYLKELLLPLDDEFIADTTEGKGSFK